LALKLIKHWVRFLNTGGGGGGGGWLFQACVAVLETVVFFLTWVTHRRSPLFLFLRPA
jgi:hypothetical protein